MIRIKPKKKTYPAYDATKAKGYAERVKALLIERGTINEDISQVCDEAKEDGCEPSMIRFVARELMMDDTVRKERDEKRARYLHAVGLAVEAVKSGEMSARQAAKVYSIGKSSVYKEMAVRELSAAREMVASDFELQPDHNPETGEITEPSCGQPDGGSAEVDADETVAAPGPHDAVMEEVERLAGIEPVVSGLEDHSSTIELQPQSGAGASEDAACKTPAGDDATTNDGIGKDDADHVPDARDMVEAPTTRSVGAVASPSEGERVAHHDHDDGLTIPSHLRGPSPANRRAV